MGRPRRPGRRGTQGSARGRRRQPTRAPRRRARAAGGGGGGRRAGRPAARGRGKGVDPAGPAEGARGGRRRGRGCLGFGRRARERRRRGGCAPLARARRGRRERAQQQRAPARAASGGDDDADSSPKTNVDTSQGIESNNVSDPSRPAARAPRRAAGYADTRSHRAARPRLPRCFDALAQTSGSPRSARGRVCLPTAAARGMAPGRQPRQRLRTHAGDGARRARRRRSQQLGGERERACLPMMSKLIRCDAAPPNEYGGVPWVIPLAAGDGHRLALVAMSGSEAITRNQYEETAPGRPSALARAGTGLKRG